MDTVDTVTRPYRVERRLNNNCVYYALIGPDGQEVDQSIFPQRLDEAAHHRNVAYKAGARDAREAAAKVAEDIAAAIRAAGDTVKGGTSDGNVS